MIAKTFFGLEKVLAEELELIGATEIQEVNRAVVFYGDKKTMYKANYLCNTAIRILKPIHEFQVRNEEELYNNIRKMQWWKLMDLEQTFAIDAVLNYSSITHSKYAGLKVKDAIADCFRDKMARRPSVDLADPDLRVNIHIFREKCTVSLDSSSISLHKRGYRITADKAPLNEVLAAGLIKLTGWKGDSDFIDPMCGSGTLLIEAALQAMGIPSGYYRKNFGFMHWKDFDKELWENIKTEALDLQKDFEHRIIGSDRSFKAISIAKENIKFARLHKDIDIRQISFDKFQPKGDNGILVFNPPYGERMETNDIVGLYKMMGDTLKSSFEGFDAWILSGNLDALKFVGLRPSRKIQVYNGAIECRFAKFEIYRGSKKQKYQNKDVNKTEDNNNL